MSAHRVTAGWEALPPEYVEEVMRRTIHCAAGVPVYCHHSPRNGSPKSQVIKRLFEVIPTFRICCGYVGDHRSGSLGEEDGATAG